MTYWEDRFSLLEQAQNKTGMDTYRDIEKVLNKTQKEIDKEIEKWIYRISTNNEVSMTEARKLLNSKELKEFKWDVKQYIKYGQENAINQNWLKELENASAKFHISRLEALKIQTQQALEVAYGNQLDSIDGMMRKVYTENYYHTAYEIQKGLHIGFDVGKINENKLNKVLNKPWTTDGKTFSDRIWTKKNQMVGELHQQITRQVIQGKSPDVAIKEMQKYVDSSVKNAKYTASRLVMTEQAFIASASTKDSYHDLDVEFYEILATLDSRTSDVCQDMDGKVFPMKDYSIGATAPPFHVFCRTTTIPHFEDNYTGERIARDAEGKTYYVPDSMKYSDWKECFVDGTKDPSEFLKPVEDVAEVKVALKDIIQSIKDDIDANGGTITEDHIKQAGKAIQDELIPQRMKLKQEWKDAESAYENSEVKANIEKWKKKREDISEQMDKLSASTSEWKELRESWYDADDMYESFYYSDDAKSFRTRIKEAEKAYKGTWESNADELKDKLSEFRQVGIGNHDLKKEHYGNRGTLRDIVTEAYSRYPSDWVEASIKKGKLSITKVQRGFYNGHEIAISGWGTESQIETAFHELGHRFEDVVKGIYEVEDVFYKRRTAGESLEWLGSGYAKHEKTRRDNFLHPYMGKEYSSKYYELVSMGFEYAYTNPTRLWEDEDYAQFIYGILALL